MRAFLIISLVAATLWACQEPEGGLKSSIEALEEEIKRNPEMDTALAKQLTDLYMKYSKDYPNDSLSPYYMSRAADIYKEVPGKRLKAVNVYNSLSRMYPDHPLSPRAVFMVGYVFDEHFQDDERASKTYRHFLEEYPEHPLAGDARNLLRLTQDSLSDEEMVAKWLQQAKEDTNSNRTDE